MQPSRQLPVRSKRHAYLRGNVLKLHFPYDRALIDKIKKIEGRRWDERAKMWSLKLSLDTIQFVLENGFDIPEPERVQLYQIVEQLLARDAGARQRAALSRAVEAPEIEDISRIIKLPPRPYQWVPAHFARLTNGRFLLADDMACVAGDSVLHINRASIGRKYKIADIYQKFHGIGRYKWDLSIPTYCRSLCDGEFRQRRIVNVLFKGIKNVVVLKTKKGKSITLTPDHEIQTSSGFVPVEKLSIGDKILTNGQVTCKECGGTKDVATYVYAKFRGYCKSCIYRFKRLNHKKQNGRSIIGRGYAFISGQYEHTRARARQVPEHILVAEQTLGRKVDWPREVVHHIDENKSNNHPSNLEVITQSEHMQRHNCKLHLGNGIKSNGRELWFTPVEDEILSIEPAGSTDVYDLVMEDPYRNFVANGIVVHNCGKSMESLVVANLPEYQHLNKLVLTPVPLTYRDEIKKFFGESAIIVDKDFKYTHPKVKYYLCSYHRLKHLFSDQERMIPREFVKQMMLIVDECHLVKNSDAQRTQYARALAWQMKYVIAMTGTPVMNSTDEIYEILMLIDKNFMSKHSFYKKFCDLKYTPFGQSHSGGTNLAQLNQWLFENVMVRREKSQKGIQDQLPEKQRQAVDSKSVLVDIEADSILEMYSKSAQAKAEDKEFQDWCQIAIENCPKVGFFYHHSAMGDMLEKLCKKLKIGYVRIDGSNPDAEYRHSLVMKFQNDLKCQVAILSMKCASQGLNGLQVAPLCIFAELPWTPGELVQAEDRFHRPGMLGDLLVMYPIFSKFDQGLTRLLLEKLETIRRITGVKQIADTVSKSSLMSQLAKEFGIPISLKGHHDA